MKPRAEALEVGAATPPHSSHAGLHRTNGGTVCLICVTISVHMQAIQWTFPLVDEHGLKDLCTGHMILTDKQPPNSPRDVFKALDKNADGFLTLEDAWVHSALLRFVILLEARLVVSCAQVG